VTDVSAQRLVHVARIVATEAAALVHAGYRSRPAASEKARNDLVTEFDVRSESLIRERLARETPDMPIVAEEQGGMAGGLTWYCDPLDGTMNFVHGHPVFCVSIGAMDEAGPVAGAVVAPALSIAWWGGRSVGAFRDGQPCAVSTVDRVIRSLLATGFQPGGGDVADSNLATFCRVAPKARGIRRCGAAAIDCCLVADGTYDGYWETKLGAWDLAAGAAIALGAGARLTSPTGGPPDLSTGSIVLTNGRIHDELVALLRD